MTSGFYDMDGLRDEIRGANRAFADEAEADALMRKLATINDMDQLNTFAAGKYRVRPMPDSVVQAIARKKVKLQKRGAR